MISFHKPFVRQHVCIRKYISAEATAKLVTSLNLSRLDYCNVLPFFSPPASSIHCLQRIQTSAARLVLRKKKTDHISPLLRSLHWLSVSQRIQYKTDTLCYKCIHESTLSYLCDTVHLYSDRHAPSSLRHMLSVSESHDPNCLLLAFALSRFLALCLEHASSLCLSIKHPP